MNQNRSKEKNKTKCSEAFFVVHITLIIQLSMLVEDFDNKLEIDF